MARNILMRTPNKVKKQMLDHEFELDIGWLMFENFYQNLFWSDQNCQG